MRYVGGGRWSWGWLSLAPTQDIVFPRDVCCTTTPPSHNTTPNKTQQPLPLSYYSHSPPEASAPLQCMPPPSKPSASSSMPLVNLLLRISHNSFPTSCPSYNLPLQPFGCKQGPHWQPWGAQPRHVLRCCCRGVWRRSGGRCWQWGGCSRRVRRVRCVVRVCMCGGGGGSVYVVPLVVLSICMPTLLLC